ncbi:mannitol dehydrogenase family protein [uncultured Tateyamaria sp.]|uniref:mannitol dehydrogenase family protein n=1 Tax=uncultured Tateyamaria sp. TaxID=455651 RepID=UPI002638B9CA|nr:mannitol dehydrogenase family protein [uncultured Tateyamaria sp.]
MRPTPILQFGTSRFLQAHADLFISQAMQQGQDVGPITVVQSTDDPGRAKRLAALVGSYPVRVEGLVDGQRVQDTLDVKSVAQTLSTGADWDDVARIFVQDARIVLSNTGDAGFAPQACDNEDTFNQAMSYPAKLTHLLRLRFAAGATPIQIMPMELVVDNGAVLKARVMELARDDAPDFRAYLGHQVTWVNSLVDRIVSQPLEPAGAVAEPYALWAIEDQPGLVLPCQHPAVQIVPSLADIEALKLFVLNLGHTFLAQWWRDNEGEDDVLVRHLVNDADALKQLSHVLRHEVRPAFDAAGLAAPFDAYVVTTLERFANPFLDHRIADIAQNHAQKVERRISAMLDWAAAYGDQSAKPVLSAIVAHNKEQI